MSISDFLGVPGRFLNLADPLWLVYFLLGLLLIVFVSQRQFNEPHWLSDDDNKIRGLPPADIVERQRFRRARRLYVLIVASVFLVLSTVPQALVVLVTMLDAATTGGFTSASADVGGVLPGLFDPQSRPGATDPFDPDHSSRLAERVEQMHSVASFPFMVAVAMIALIRIPYAQKVEREVRRFAQEWYGIPTISETLFHRLRSHDFPVDDLDVALAEDPVVAPIKPRVQALTDAAQAVLGQAMNRKQFHEGLVKILAFRIWVGDFKVWPSPDVFPQTPLLHRWSRRILQEIAALQLEIELMSAEEDIWKDMESDPQKVETIRRVRFDRWKRIDSEITRLAEDVCSLVVLLDQRSQAPNTSRPVGEVLRTMLTALHVEDIDHGPVVGRLILLVALIPVIWLGLSVFNVQGWRAIAVDQFSDSIPFGEPGFSWRDQGSNYDFVQTGITFALSGLAVYGVAVLVGGLWIGRQLGRETGSARVRTPLFIRVLGVSMVCFFAVALAFAAQLILLVAANVDWDPAELMAWLRVPNALASMVVAVLAQAALGATFGGMVALLTAPEMRASKAGVRLFWGGLMVLVMAVGGYLYGRFAVPARLEMTRELHALVYMAGAGIMAALSVALLSIRNSLALAGPGGSANRRPAATPLRAT